MREKEYALKIIQNTLKYTIWAYKRKETERDKQNYKNESVDMIYTIQSNDT